MPAETPIEVRLVYTAKNANGQFTEVTAVWKCGTLKAFVRLQRKILENVTMKTLELADEDIELLESSTKDVGGPRSAGPI